MKPSMKMPIKSVCVAAGLLALAPLAAHGQERDPVRHGRQLVGQFCAQCHAVARFGRSPHRAAPLFRTLGRTIDLDGFARALSGGLESEHPGMPSFKFGIDDARDVRAYLRTIQR
jgi:mono/diheme cytochrome c family protein